MSGGPPMHTLRAGIGVLLVTLAWAAAPRPVAAQGLHAGMAWSRLTEVDGFKARRGWVFGASLSFLRVGPVAVSPELLYMQKGARLETPAESGIDDVRIDWFEVPVLVEVGSYLAGTPFRPSVYLGPYFGFRSGCSFGFADGSDRSGDCLFAGLQEIGIDGAFAENDFGWVLGGAVELYTAEFGSVSLDARYTGSFSDIMRTGSTSQPKTRSLIVMLGWLPGER